MSRCDVVIIGAGIPGLAAALALARAHRTVTVIEPDHRPGGVLAGQLFDSLEFASGPVISYGFEPGGPFRRLFAAAGLPAYHTPPKLTYQVLLPEHRITVFTDPAGTLEELRREFPGEIDRLAAFYREMEVLAGKEPRSRFTRWAVRRRRARTTLAPYRFSEAVSAFFDVQARTFWGRSLADLTLHELMTMIVLPPVLLPDGFHGLARRLRDAFTSIGGSYRTSGSWPQIQARSKRMIGTELQDGPVESRAAVLNSSWSGERALFLGLRSAALPVDMAPHVLCLPDQRTPDDIVLLTVLRGRSPGQGGPEDACAVTANVSADARKDAQAGVLRETVRNIMPFMDPFVQLSGEADPDARRPALLGSLEASAPLRSEGRSIRDVRSLKHMYLLQDRTHAVNKAVEDALRLASSLA